MPVSSLVCSLFCVDMVQVRGGFQMKGKEKMKIIALEEHFQIASIKKAVAKFFPGQNAFHLTGYDPSDAQLNYFC